MASVDLNALTEVQNPASTDNLLLFNETSNVATRIDYDKLAEAILNKTRSEIGGVSPISAITALNSSSMRYFPVEKFRRGLISTLFTMEIIFVTQIRSINLYFTNPLG